MVKAVVILFAIGLAIVPLAAGQSGRQDVPPCPDSPQNYPDNMIRPKYPKEALRTGTSANVDLRAVIAPDGKIENLAVLDGDPAFSQAAEAAIRKWRFHPQARNGHAIESVYKIQVRFNPLLQEANSDVELESPPPKVLPIPTLETARKRDLSLEIHRSSESGVVAPKAIYQPEPEFSETARKEKIQGKVYIDLVVRPDGFPGDLRIVCSPEPGLGKNALAAAQQWKFTPGTKDGQPVAVEIQVEVSFKLN
jgi:TonB family protein